MIYFIYYGFLSNSFLHLTIAHLILLPSILSHLPLNIMYKQTHGRRFILTVTDNLKAEEESGIGSQKATNWTKEPASVSRSAGSVRPPQQFSSQDNLCLSFFFSFCFCVSILWLFVRPSRVSSASSRSAGNFLWCWTPSWICLQEEHLSFVLIPFLLFAQFFLPFGLAFLWVVCGNGCHLFENESNK